MGIPIFLRRSSTTSAALARCSIGFMCARSVLPRGRSFSPGDIIRAINQTLTPDLATFANVTAHVKLPEGVVLDVIRQGQPLYLSYTEGD